ncbi:MAG: hypothetical protein BWY76_03301 [bacterium ADurb.Bin429]|nr:MAG: hypothetical protein BWY76_03301 [bacterium ADurb.Bin429]
MAVNARPAAVAVDEFDHLRHVRHHEFLEGAWRQVRRRAVFRPPDTVERPTACFEHAAQVVHDACVCLVTQRADELRPRHRHDGEFAELEERRHVADGVAGVAEHDAAVAHLGVEFWELGGVYRHGVEGDGEIALRVFLIFTKMLDRPRGLHVRGKLTGGVERAFRRMHRRAGDSKLPLLPRLALGGHVVGAGRRIGPPQREGVRFLGDLRHQRLIRRLVLRPPPGAEDGELVGGYRHAVRRLPPQQRQNAFTPGHKKLLYGLSSPGRGSIPAASMLS